MHARGVAHLDIKPANILHDAATGGFVLMDFGNWSPLGRKRSGVCDGTPAFAAIHCHELKPVTVQDDWDALDIVRWCVRNLKTMPPFKYPPVKNPKKMLVREWVARDQALIPKKGHS